MQYRAYLQATKQWQVRDTISNLSTGVALLDDAEAIWLVYLTKTLSDGCLTAVGLFAEALQLVNSYFFASV